MDSVQKDVAYLRLSLADGDGKDESTSISSQRKRIWDFWKKQGQGTKLEEYIDDGFSGTNFERPGFQRLLSEVREGKVRTLLVKRFIQIWTKLSGGRLLSGICISLLWGQGNCC